MRSLSLILNTISVCIWSLIASYEGSETISILFIISSTVFLTWTLSND